MQVLKPAHDPRNNKETRTTNTPNVPKTENIQ